MSWTAGRARGNVTAEFYHGRDGEAADVAGRHAECVGRPAGCVSVYLKVV